MRKLRNISFTVLAVVLIGMIAMILYKQFGTTSGSSEWVILTAESTKDAANTLKDTIAKSGAASVSVTTQMPDSYGGRLILVGETGQEASQKAFLSLKEDEFLCEFGKESIVIVGGSDDKTTEAVEYVCEKYGEYLADYRDLPYGSDYDYVSTSSASKTVNNRLLIGGVNISRFEIGTEDGEKTKAAIYLQDALNNITGQVLPIVSKEEAGDYVIEIASGKEDAAKGLSDKQYHIYLDGTKLYLCASSQDQELLVVKMLLTKYLAYEYINQASSESTISLDDLDFKFTCNWDEFTSPEVVQSKILEIPAANGYSVLQGGCTDGTYGYYILNNQNVSPYENQMYKVDLSTMQIVKISENLTLQHANSLTYNSKLKTLVCVNYDPDKTTLTYVDPDSLKITGTAEVEFNALSLAYNTENDTYVAGTRGTFDFFSLDGNLKVTGYHSSVQTDSVKQEVEVYEGRSIFSMSGPNILYVYDEDGSFLYSIEMGLKAEIENLIFYGDVAYTGYYSAGGIFYESIFYQELK